MQTSNKRLSISHETDAETQVYSCDYQRLMLSYETECFENFYKTDPALPFYPPPAEAAGQCACNLGNYLDAIRNVGFGALTCANETNANASQAASDCGCCFYGATFAAMDDICPDTNPQLLGLGDVDAIYIQGGDEADDNGDNIGLCVSRIGSSGNFSCANHGWDTYGTNASDYAKPTPVHSATGALTDLPGAITSPVSGATYTWTAFNGTYTITAASVEAVATRSVATTGSAKGSSTSDSAKTATGTAAVSSVASGAAAAVTGYVQGPVAAIAGLAGLAFALL